MELIPLLKQNGTIAIWVYDNYNKIYCNSLDMLRKITTKIPQKLLYFISIIASNSLYYIYKIKPLKILWFFIPVSMHKNRNWRILDTYDLYSPAYQSKHTCYEVFLWFQEAGLKNITILEPPVSVKGSK